MICDDCGVEIRCVKENRVTWVDVFSLDKPFVKLLFLLRSLSVNVNVYECPNCGRLQARSVYGYD